METQRTDDQWRQLATSSSWTERATCAREWAGMSIKIAKKLARDEHIEVRKALAERVHPLPTSVIADLATSPNPHVRATLAGGAQPLTDAQHDTLMKDSHHPVRVALARSTRPVDDAIVEKFLKSPDDIRSAFVESGRPIPSHLQQQLSNDPSIKVRYELAAVHGSRGQLDQDAHLILAMDDDRTVRAAASDNVDVDLLNYAAASDNDAVRAAASDFTLGLIAGDGR